MGFGIVIEMDEASLANATLVKYDFDMFDLVGKSE
jgi:hypothetical protein